MTTDPDQRASGPNLQELLLTIIAPGTELLSRDLVDDALGSVPGIGGHGRQVLVDGLSRLTESFLDLDLGQAALTGWRRHEELLSAARSTLATPGLTEIVDLTSHDVSVTWHPSIDVLLGQAQVGRLSVDVTLTLRMIGVFATVSGGRLTGIGGGRCDVTVLLALSGDSLLERTVPVAAELLSMSTGRGIALMAADPDVAA